MILPTFLAPLIARRVPAAPNPARDLALIGAAKRQAERRSRYIANQNALADRIGHPRLFP